MSKMFPISGGFFRREMFRIQSRQPVPARAGVRDAGEHFGSGGCGHYGNVSDGVGAGHRLASSGQFATTLRNQLMVIALGRLGMREFDLASDADLVFVLPDEDLEEHLFWTRVAGRMIDLITAYTGSGLMFSVDTRLRPNGSAGALVQSEASYKDYFSKNAEAWEGIAYMKARAVAGDTERATTVPQRFAASGLAPVRPERPLKKRLAADALAA